MLVVTGASGKLGRRIVEQLLEVVPANRVGVSVRNPDGASGLAQRGVRVRYGDFAKADSLVSSFEGASQVLIVSSNAAAVGGDPIAQHRNAIDAARAAGAWRIIYTSHMGASSSSAFPPMHTHAATEVMLRDSGTAWTALRNGFYASTIEMMIGDAASSGVLAAPQDGKVAWTAHADLAAAAAAILVDEGRFDGPTPPLTAAEAQDLSDVAAILVELYAKPVERRVVTDEEQAAMMADRGAPPAAVEMTLGMYRAARNGEFAPTDPALSALLRRKPLSVRDVLTKGSDA
ncbi:NAD(P)H-binding protein [Sphingomonas sp.]|uniref:NAD(P)H-binding protein n=1 Tax=Sphingomonas sp. TaxID=28214 RepID=UPI0025EB2FBB|nr:NAD(P)H-binding protein [Sphingomonas sp.]